MNHTAAIRINRNIVECKYARTRHRSHRLRRINRNIVECKFDESTLAQRVEHLN